MHSFLRSSLVSSFLSAGSARRQTLFTTYVSVQPKYFCNTFPKFNVLGGPLIEFQCYYIRHSWFEIYIKYSCGVRVVAQRIGVLALVFPFHSFTYFHYLKIVSWDPRTFCVPIKTPPNVSLFHQHKNDLHQILIILFCLYQKYLKFTETA